MGWNGDVRWRSQNKSVLVSQRQRYRIHVAAGVRNRHTDIAADAGNHFDEHRRVGRHHRWHDPGLGLHGAATDRSVRECHGRSIR